MKRILLLITIVFAFVIAFGDCNNDIKYARFFGIDDCHKETKGINLIKYSTDTISSDTTIISNNINKLSVCNQFDNIPVIRNTNNVHFEIIKHDTTIDVYIVKDNERIYQINLTNNPILIVSKENNLITELKAIDDNFEIRLFLTIKNNWFGFIRHNNNNEFGCNSHDILE